MLLHSTRVVFILLALAVPILAAWVQIRSQRNLRVLEPGILYRSGQMDVANLKRTIHDHGIRTVITLRETTGDKVPKLVQEEEDYCKTNGIYFYPLPIRGWEIKKDQTEAPAMENIRELLKILDDPKHHPVLLHCFAGVHRTGVYCAVCRLERQGWDVDRAVAEMRECGYTQDQFDKHTDVQAFLRNYKRSRN